MNPMKEARETAALLTQLDPRIESELGSILWCALLEWLALAGWPERLALATARTLLAWQAKRLAV